MIIANIKTQEFACKTIWFSNDGLTKTLIEREFSILSRLNHPNILRYVDCQWEPNKAKLYTEYCSQGSLEDVIKKHETYVRSEVFLVGLY